MCAVWLCGCRFVCALAEWSHAAALGCTRLCREEHWAGGRASQRQGSLCGWGDVRWVGWLSWSLRRAQPGSIHVCHALVKKLDKLGAALDVFDKVRWVAQHELTVDSHRGRYWRTGEEHGSAPGCGIDRACYRHVPGTMHGRTWHVERTCDPRHGTSPHSTWAPPRMLVPCADTMVLGVGAAPSMNTRRRTSPSMQMHGNWKRHFAISSLSAM